MTRTILRNVFAPLAFAAFLVPSLAFGAEYALSDMSAKTSGRAYAASASTDSPSVIFYNPANITELKGFQVELGGSILMPRFKYDPGPVGHGAEVKSNVIGDPVPAISLTYNLGHTDYGDFAAGLGFYATYGAKFSWPGNWAGNTQVVETGLSVLEVMPTLAWKPIKYFSIGASLRIMPTSLYLNQAVQFASTSKQGTLEASASGTGWGAAVGASIFPIERLSIGLEYRSRAMINVNGSSAPKISGPYDAQPQAAGADASGQIPIADEYRIGVQYEVLAKQLWIEADAQLQRWSYYKSVSFTLTYPTSPTYTTPTPQIIPQSPHGKDVVYLALGGDYAIDSDWTVRAGYGYDPHWQPENTVSPAPPDSDRHIATLGASYKFNDWAAAHLYFADIFFVQRTTTTSAFPATYSGGYPLGTSTYIVGLTLSGTFDLPTVLPPEAATTGTAPATAPETAPQSAPAATPL